MTVNNHMGNEQSSLPESDIVITGVSGRYPQSGSVEELWNNLINGKILYGPDTFPYPRIFTKTPKSRGALKDTRFFDNEFFGYDLKSANTLDPQIRLLLEVVYEALWDAGIPPETWRGTRTGFFLGSSFDDTGLSVRWDYKIDFPQYFAQRVAYHFDWKGPTMIVDTACAASLNALHEAYYALLNGSCDQAVVAGISVHLKPSITICFGELEMLSKSGQSRCLDADADGYIRSEAIVSLVLQRAPNSKRIYAQILSSCTSSDGYTKEGITFPRREVQVETMKEALNRAQVKPSSVEYVEAHITGTAAGDPIESSAIIQAYRGGSMKPLMVGCLKANIGHCEASAGLCAVTKVLKIFQNQMIPRNVGMNVPNPRIDSLREGQLITLSANTPFDGNVIGIDAFGFGGSNTHCLVKAPAKRNPGSLSSPLSGPIPRLLCCCNRTQSGLQKMINLFESRSNMLTAEFCALLHEISQTSPETGVNWRGYTVIGADGKAISTGNLNITERRSICLFFDCNPVQSIPTDLMNVEPFAQSIERSKQYLTKRGVKGDQSIVNTVLCQLAYVDIMKQLGLVPTVLIGLDFGKLAAHYAAGDASLDETLEKLASYAGGITINGSNGLVDEVKHKKGYSSNKLTDLEAKSRTLIESLITSRGQTLDEVFIWSKGSSNSQNVVIGLNSSMTVLSDLMSTSIVPMNKNSLPSGKVTDLKLFLETLGALYLTGSNPQIQILYPPIQWPVSGSCPSLGHLMEWKHDLTFENLIYPEFFRDAFHTAHRIDLMDAAFTELTGYSVEGQTILPTAGYIWIIWDHLVKMRCPDQRLRVHSFELWSVTIHASADIKEPAEFRVVSNPVTHEFTIRLNTQVIVTGFARIADGESFDYSPYLGLEDDHDNTSENEAADQSLQLTADEFYFEMEIRGWKSGEAFRNVTNVSSDGAAANIKFTGNWITFMESILMIPLISEYRDRSIAIPKYLEWFRCDPLMLNESLKIQRKNKSESGFPVFIRQDTQTIATDGLALRVPDYQAVPHILSPPDLHYRHQTFLPYNGRISLDPSRVQTRNDLLSVSSELLNAAKSRKSKSVKIEPFNDSKLVEILKLASESKNPATFLSSNICNLVKTFELEVFEGIHRDLSGPHLDIFEENSKSSGSLNVIQVGRDSNISYGDLCDHRFRKVRSRYEFEAISGLPASGDLVSYDLVVYNHDSMGLPQGDMKLKKEDLSVFSALPASAFLLVVLRESLFSFEESLLKLLNQPAPNMKSADFIRKSITELNFAVVSEYHVTDGNFRSILFRKLGAVNLSESPYILTITERSYEWVNELKAAVNDQANSRIWIVSNSSNRSGVVGLGLALKEETFGSRIKCILAPGFDPLKSPEVFEKLRTSDLLINVYTDGEWGSFRHIDLSPREEVFVSDSRAYLSWSRINDAESLQEKSWTPHWFRNPMDAPQDHIINYFSALNYHDKAISLGQATPNEILFPWNGGIGWEFAGLTRDGKRVFGLCNGRGVSDIIPTSSVIFSLPVPNKWSLREAGTVLLPYSIALYCLQVRSLISKSDNVSIHGLSDGIDLAVISICLNIGADIYIHITNKELQRSYKAVFPSLRDKNFIIADDYTFDEVLLRKTRGEGINIAFNMGATSRLKLLGQCLVTNGRIFHITGNGKIESSSLTQGVLPENGTLEVVSPFDVLQNMSQDRFGSNKTETLKNHIQTNLSNGTIKPLPSITFDRDAVDTAIGHLRKSSNSLERVVIKIREEKSNSKQSPSEAKSVKCVARSFFYPNKSYILIGGLGGVGLQLLRWMVERGARNIVVTSRSGFSNQYQKFIVNRLRKYRGARVNIILAEISTTSYESIAQVIREAKEYGPVGGIFNLAGILKGGLFENQTPENFTEVCLSKVEITEYLDSISRVQCPALDHFVCFSSISALGVLGESNYGYANSYTERICEERRAQGLPALAVQWAAIGDVGMAKHLPSFIAGSTFRRVLGCILDVDKFLQVPYPVCYAVQHAFKQDSGGDGKGNILQRIGHILGLKNLESLDGSVTLGDLGLDSLQAIEVKNLIDTTFKINMPNIAILKLSIEALMKMQAEETGDGMGGEDGSNFEEAILINLTDKGTDPIFFFPPAFFDFLSMQPVAEALNRTVIGVQMTEKVRQLGTFDKISEFYADTILEAYPNLKRYDFVGYSFGCSVSFELAKVMQPRIGKERLDRIVFIDASPYGLKKLGQKTAKMILAGYPIWEIFIITMECMGVRISEEKREMLMEAEDDEVRYKELVQEILVEAGMNGPTDSLVENAVGLVDRGYYLSSMKELGIFNGDALFVQVINKAVQASGCLSLVNEGLPEIVGGHLKTIMFNASHFDILKVYAREVADEIEKMMPLD